MRISTVISLKGNAKSRIDDMFSHARHFGLHHDEIMKKTQIIFNELRAKKIPNWAIEYIKGYYDARHSDLYQHVAWVHVSPEGEFYVSHKPEGIGFGKNVDELYKSGLGSEIAKWEHGHIWIEASQREIKYGRKPKFLNGPNGFQSLSVNSAQSPPALRSPPAS